MQLPARVGKYELEEFLGGGMSHVYRARDTVIGRTVAVKILTEAGCEDAEAKARFLAEARMAGNIQHDNILSIYDFGEDEQHRPFMVMEFLRGEDLRHAIKNGHLPDLTAKLKVALQVARAMQYVHSQKIIHRDIKPENIHINPAGVVKLMDFGIAKTEGLSMTRAGYVLGTPYYMAPEQVTGGDVTEQVDVYSFGILLFELVTGMKPISGDTVERIFFSILNEQVNLAPLFSAGAPQAICDLVTHCTAKDPEARPQGFEPVCAELERVLADSSAATETMPAMAPAGAPAKPGFNWKLLAALAMLLVGAPLLYFAMRGGNVPKVPEPPPKLMLPSGDMVLIPAGPFQFGKDKQPADLSAFYIDRTEVTNAAYGEFCKQTGRALPDGFPQDKAEYPVVNVSYVDAHAFADWARKRLPNAMEWEKAARGTDGRVFPWGNEPDVTKANVKSNELKPADDLKAGGSPFGALQMVGNVWELVDQIGNPSEAQRQEFEKKMNPPPAPGEPWYSMRGLSFRFPALATEALWDAASVPARYKALDIGFRCVKDAR